MIPTHLYGIGSKLYLIDMSGAEKSLSFVNTLTWADAEQLYCYPTDRFCEYSMRDRQWTEYCGIGKLIRVEFRYKDGYKVHIQPKGWCLPYDFEDRIKIRMPYYPMPNMTPQHRTILASF